MERDEGRSWEMQLVALTKRIDELEGAQRRTIQSVTNIALSNHELARRLDEQQELQLATLAGAVRPHPSRLQGLVLHTVPAGRSDEATDKITLPGKIEVEAPRRTTRAVLWWVLRWLGIAVAAGVGALGHHLAQWWRSGR